MQRALDRQQVQHDLQRIAWAQDYDACAACLQHLCDAVDALTTPGEADIQLLREGIRSAIAQARTLLNSPAVRH